MLSASDLRAGDRDGLLPMAELSENDCDCNGPIECLPLGAVGLLVIPVGDAKTCGGRVRIDDFRGPTCDGRRLSEKKGGEGVNGRAESIAEEPRAHLLLNASLGMISAV